MRLKLLIIVFSCFVFSCVKDKCNNSGNAWGKYINDNDKTTLNFLVIKEDGTYIQHYKMHNLVEKTNLGKWRLSKDECKIYFDGWCDFFKKNKIISSEAYYRNDKLYFEDIDNADYEKE